MCVNIGVRLNVWRDSLNVVRRCHFLGTLLATVWTNCFDCFALNWINSVLEFIRKKEGDLILWQMYIFRPFEKCRWFDFLLLESVHQWVCRMWNDCHWVEIKVLWCYFCCQGVVNRRLTIFKVYLRNLLKSIWLICFEYGYIHGICDN